MVPLGTKEKYRNIRNSSGIPPENTTYCKDEISDHILRGIASPPPF